MCHAEEPVYEGIYHAPKGVLLDTDERIAEHAREIYIQAGRAHAMPALRLDQVAGGGIHHHDGESRGSEKQ